MVNGIRLFIQLFVRYAGSALETSTGQYFFRISAMARKALAVAAIFAPTARDGVNGRAHPINMSKISRNIRGWSADLGQEA